MTDHDTTPTQADDPLTEDEVARLFRENDNIGPDSALPLRMIRQLIWDGKPLGQGMMLTFKSPDGDSLLFGAVTATRNHRLVFWPALPTGMDMPCDNIEAVDHITLELPSEKSHATGYKANREAVHRSRAWKLHHYPDSGLAAWFALHVRLSVLRGQPQVVQRKVAVPTADKERRLEEVGRFVQGLQIVPIPVPDGAGDHVTAVVYLATAPVGEINFSASVFPTDSMAREVDGWPDGKFPVGPSTVRVGERTLLVAASRPPGTLKSMEVGIGFLRPAAPAAGPTEKQ